MRPLREGETDRLLRIHLSARHDEVQDMRWRAGPMTTDVFAGWDGSIPGARALQERLAASVLLEDRGARGARTIAGFDVGEDEGRTTRAAPCCWMARACS